MTATVRSICFRTVAIAALLLSAYGLTWVGQAQAAGKADAPTNLTGAIVGGNIVLTWDAVNDDSVTGYQLLRRSPQDDQSSLAKLESVDGSDTTQFTDATVEEGHKYIYRVKGVNERGPGRPSNRVSLVVPSSIPGKPENLVATHDDGAMTLTWDAPEGDVDGYQILRRKSSTGNGEFMVQVEDTQTGETEWTDEDIDGGERYVYRVAAINDGLRGKPSAPDSVRVPADEKVMASVSVEFEEMPPGWNGYMNFVFNNVPTDGDPKTVDITFRADVKDSNDNNANRCEGEGFGKDIERTDPSEKRETIETEFGGFNCGAGVYTVTFALHDSADKELVKLSFDYTVKR